MSAQKAKGHEAVPRKNDISMLCLVISTVLLNKLFCHLSVLTRLACVHITSCQTYRPGFQHRKCQLTLLRCQYKAVQLVWRRMTYLCPNASITKVYHFLMQIRHTAYSASSELSSNIFVQPVICTPRQFTPQASVHLKQLFTSVLES